MLVHKITIGFVDQTFNTATGKYTGQEFIAGEVEYEGDEQNDYGEYVNDNGEVIDDVQNEMPTPEPYLPFEMVQPND